MACADGSILGDSVPYKGFHYAPISLVVDAIEGRYVLFHERWSSFQDFERHVRSDLYERVLAALDMASEPPEVRFDCMGRTWGLDLVRDLRMEGENENSE